jgi:Domain of unknown function (DUF3475)
MVPKDGKISILCFEVANTVLKGAKLMESLSDVNVKHYKEVVLQSQGIQILVSNDMQELLKLAAADKRCLVVLFCLYKQSYFSFKGIIVVAVIDYIVIFLEMLLFVVLHTVIL